MKRAVCELLGVFLAIVALSEVVHGEVPQGVFYQGRLTDPVGVPVDDGTYLVKFVIYDSQTGDNALWNSQFQAIQVANGIFSVHLGAPPMAPLPWDLFEVDSARYLGVTVGVDPEIRPLVKFTSAAYAYHALTSDRAGQADHADQAETVVRSRDLYHSIMDVMPGGDLTIPFISNVASPTVKLYLYGSEFQGVLQQHTHAGENAHSHSITGVVGSRSVAHEHSYSGTTGNNSVTHTHSGATAGSNLNHTHSVSVDPHNLQHNHSATTSQNTHRHVLVVDGLPGTGNYLVHASGTSLLSSSDTPDRFNNGSIMLDSHTHTLSTSSDLGTSVGHSASSSAALSTHDHSFSSGTNSVSHDHGYSGVTGSDEITHDHTFSGSVESFGTGLEAAGTASGALPADVTVYVDGSPAAGPFSGAFTTGVLDLSSYVTGAGEHSVEIRVEGSSGGRITYNLLVE